MKAGTSGQAVGGALPAGQRGLDWRMLAMLLPARRFTAAELLRAVPEPANRSLKVATVFNVAVPVVALLVLLGRSNPAVFSICLIAQALVTLWVLRAIWRDPSSRLVHWLYYLLPVLCMLPPLMLKRWAPEVDRVAMLTLGMMSMATALGLWFATLYRYQYIVIRLRELDERDRAVDMARQLASAQIQPHFLFNSLASLQHWVHTRDERAGPMLDSLTAYLRATLPLFERAHLTVAEEFEAVRRYLEVMQARLGERLRFELALQPEAGTVAMPPGLLLTLVENAVEHGVQPQLAGGTVRVCAQLGAGGRVLIDVCDDGPGLASDPPPGDHGVGLRNSRERLAQAYGQRASLRLSEAPGGGCIARLSLPAAAVSPLP